MEHDKAHLTKLVQRFKRLGMLSPLALLSERSAAAEAEVEAVEKELRAGIEARPAAGKASYPLWPAQFSCNHTSSVVSGPRASEAQKGVFYYDAPKHRQATVFYDVASGAEWKEVVKDGSVFTVRAGTCTSRTWTETDLIPPDFLQYFAKQKDQYVL